VLRLATRWHGQGPLTLPGRLQVERVAGVLQLRR